MNPEKAPVMDPLSVVKDIMIEFAESTGLSNPENPPRRYLWTDAFGICNFLELYRQTADEHWRRSALNLINQVHTVLGHHRQDDPRTGWISNLSESEGARHPTIGGLRIGKSMNERKPADPYNEREEWDRDGQYYHYLTKWMHALNRMSRSTGESTFNLWAIELARTAHAAFVYTLPSGHKRMYWKMSIDLSFPLVASMGQHDPLDGLITYRQLQATAQELSPSPEARLDSEIADMESLCQGHHWTTADPLGIGGILSDAYRVLQLDLETEFTRTTLFNELLESSLVGLDAFTQGHSLGLSADYRLAFRELGMSIGLHAVERIKGLIELRPDVFPQNHPAHGQINRLHQYVPLGQTIETFWRDPRCRESQTWTGHLDINRVMLATSLAPDGYLTY
jgi:hypothetical protein